MLSPGEFVLFYAQVGEKKCANSAVRLFLAAVLAGFFIASGAVAAGTASYGLDNPSIARVVSGLLFPFGLIMVILTGAELFTGNCMIAISLLERKAGPAGMVRNLAIVYLGNFTGAGLLAAAMAFSGAFSNEALAVYVIRSAAAKCAIPFGRAVVLGILCNILVCAGVMCSLCGKSLPGRAIGAFVPVSFFVIGGFEHCVANMYYIPAGLLAAGLPGCAGLAREAGIDLSLLSLGGLFTNLIPVTIGNIIGGCGFGALIWACHRRPA
ncbi:formate/nitrite transporter family protein [Pseudoflavonifractor sp. 60]|uniref:formate/nitrite transporter family protein n=1 Tax=Pseudoflavonifractor sp. 60 TaxID=2304576 RepID=UPI001367F414|nr:formate/nitrite transporter family protein [Pseudoflavonifractor sp. 60]NBI65824.1 formate/nitrite transporter family protein [Pseudoflavonifractor sp. 60]